MSEKEYPFKAWVLMPSFAPKEIELVEGSATVAGYHITASNKYYHESQLFESKRAAIANGWSRIDELQAALEKRAESISKKKSSLTRHSL